MSGPPKVGIGEQLRIARKNKPAAPKCNSVEVKDRCGGRRLWAWKRTSNIFALYQVLWRPDVKLGEARRGVSTQARRKDNPPQAGLREGMWTPVLSRSSSRSWFPFPYHSDVLRSFSRR